MVLEASSRRPERAGQNFRRGQMTSIRSDSPRSRFLPRAFAVAVLAAGSVGTAGCYDCLYCDGVQQVDGWVQFNFVEAGGSTPLAGLEVVFNSAARSLNRTTNTAGAVVLQDLAGATLNFTMGLPVGYTFESPPNGQLIISFAEDTTRTVVSVIPPGT